MQAFLGPDLGANYWTITAAPRPIEMLFNSPVGSVLSFEQTPQGVLPLREREPDSQVRAFLDLQNEVIEALPRAASIVRQRHLTVNDCRFALAGGIASLLTKPSREMVRQYLSARHDEIYGLGKEVIPSSHSLTIGAVANLLARRDTFSLREAYWQCGWGEALAQDVLGFRPPASTLRLMRRAVVSR
jgi:hypothetical protein